MKVNISLEILIALSDQLDVPLPKLLNDISIVNGLF